MKTPLYYAKVQILTAFILVVIFAWIGLLAVNNHHSIAGLDATIQKAVLGIQIEWGMVWMEKITAIGDGDIISFFLGVTLLLFMFLRQWRSATLLAVAFWLNSHITAFTKSWFWRERPQISWGYTSYPSGHTTTVFIVFIILAIGLSRTLQTKTSRVAVWVACSLVVVAVGASRVYLNVHWFSDVVGGCLLAGAIVLTLNSVMLVLEHFHFKKNP